MQRLKRVKDYGIMPEFGRKKALQILQNSPENLQNSMKN